MGGLVLVGVSTGGEDAMSAFGGLSYLGDLLALLAAVVWAVYSMLVKRIGELGYAPIASTKRRFLWGLGPRRARHLPGIMSRICFSWD